MVKNERLNSITHLVGASLTLPAGSMLVILAALQGNTWKIISFLTFTFTLFLLFLFSTLYHSFQGTTKAVFRKLDHISIYLLIAGSYTPFTLISLRNTIGWEIFGTIWILALLGILIEFLPRQGKRILPILLYLGMGWLILIPYKTLIHSFPIAGFIWLLTGGAFYTIGAGFYIFSKKISWFHAVWHIFVIFGSTCHYLAMYLYLL